MEHRSTKRPNARPTVALVLASLHTGAARSVWPAVADEAARADANLFCFPGGRVGLSTGHEASRNSIYELGSLAGLDGALIWTSSLSGAQPAGAVDRVVAGFRDIPAVGLSAGTPGLPIVEIDYYGGMREAVRHLVAVHGHRSVALLRGPERHPGAEDRYRAYLDTLRSEGIEPSPLLVSSPSSWDAGSEALLELVDGRSLVPGRDFRALVAASDLMILPALGTLRSRGYGVPADLAVAGINDSVESRIADPPLTTAQAPFQELGATALRSLMRLMAGEEVPPSLRLESRLIVRQSCGCPSASFLIAGDEEPGLAAAERGADVVEQARAALGATSGTARDWIAPLAAAWESAVATGEGGRFYDILVRIADRSSRLGMEIAPWQGVVSLLRRSALRSRALSRHVEELSGRARVLLAESAERAAVFRAWEEERRAEELRELDRELLSAMDADSLGRTLAAALPRLGIRSAYACRYEEGGPRGPASLLFGLRDGESVGGRGIRFPAAELVPSALLPDRRLAYVVEPLFFHESPIGYALFEIGPRSGALYEELRDTLSGALRGAILLERADEARKRAERADGVKTRLLSNVSHELRSPVDVILRSVERLERLAGEPESRSAGREGLAAGQESLATEAAVELKRIRSNAEHQKRLVDDLLDISRAEMDELDVDRILADPGPIAREVFEDLSADSCRPGAEVEWVLDLPPRLPLAMIDPMRFRQILTNLLVNARKFTKRGRITLRASAAPPRMVFEVEDTGSGIPKERLERLFEPFISSGGPDGGPSGVGLGLSITRHLVVLHLGEIEVESAEGSGSLFRVSLPLPSLEGRAAREMESGFLLVVAGSDEAAAEIAAAAAKRGVDSRRATLAEAEAGLLESLDPAAVAWDMASAGPAEWGLFRKIRRHARLSALPFLLYGPAPGAAAEDGAAAPAGFLSKGSEGKALADAIMLCSPPGGDAPILVADDDATALEQVVGAIRASFPEIEVVTARDGNEAWEAMRSRPPRLAVLDLAMPGLSGLDLVERLRADERLFTVPAIILTNKVVTAEDARRLAPHSRVVLQNKGIWTEEDLGAGVSRLLYGDGAPAPPSSAAVKRAIAYMNANFRGNVTRWKLAEAALVSEDHLTRIFRRELGIGPWDYLARLRIRAAKELLMSGSEPLARIAQSVGFSDQAYFCRVFKKLTGMTPQSFRESGSGGARKG